jgi:hypothetical protein
LIFIFILFLLIFDSVLAISCNEEKKKVTVVAQVPSTLVEKGLKASEWAGEVVAVVGGKGGGKVLFFFWFFSFLFYSLFLFPFPSPRLHKVQEVRPRR